MGTTGTVTIDKNLLKIGQQIIGGEVGKNSPVIETSYIAAPNSIVIEESDLGGLPIYNVTWTPLTSYLGDLRNDIDDLQKEITYFGSLDDIKISDKTSVSLNTNFQVISNVSKNSNTIVFERRTVSVQPLTDVINTVSRLNTTISQLNTTVTQLSSSVSSLSSKINSLSGEISDIKDLIATYHPAVKPTPTLSINLSTSSNLTVPVNTYFNTTFTVTSTNTATPISLKLTDDADSGIITYFKSIGGHGTGSSSASGLGTQSLSGIPNNATINISGFVSKISGSSPSGFTIKASQSATSSSAAASTTQRITVSSYNDSGSTSPIITNVDITTKPSSVYVGNTGVAKAKLQGTNLSQSSSVSWTASPSGIINITKQTMDSGSTTSKTSTMNFTALKSGSVTIKATSVEDSSKYDSAMMSVSNKTTPTITISNAPSSIVVNKQKWGTTSFNVSTNNAGAGNITVSTSTSGTSLSAYISKVNTSTISGNKTSTSVANNSTVYISYYSNSVGSGSIGITASQLATTSTNAASATKTIQYTVIEQYNPSIKIVSYQPTMTAGTSAQLFARSYDIDNSYYSILSGTVSWSSSNSSVAAISGISSSSTSSYIFSKASISAKSAGNSTITVKMKDPTYIGSSESGYYLTDSFVVTVSGSTESNALYYWGTLNPYAEDYTSSYNPYFNESYFTGTNSKIIKLNIVSTSGVSSPTYYYIYPKTWGTSARISINPGKYQGTDVSARIKPEFISKYNCTMLAGTIIDGVNGKYDIIYN